MPNLRNAKKALRQSEKRASRNKLVKDEIQSLRRHFRVALKSRNTETAQKFASDLQKKLDKAAQKNVLPDNRVNRLKSRMASALKKISA